MTGPAVTGPLASYVPGEWYAVIGDRVRLLLPASERARVARLWELVEEGAGVDDVLDLLVSRGLRDLPAFVLIGPAGDQTRVLARGDVVCTVLADGEDVRIEGHDRPWAEERLARPARVRVEVAPDDGGAPLPAGPGLVRLARYDEPPVTVVPAGDGRDPETVPVPLASSDHDGLTVAPTPAPAPGSAAPPRRPVARLLLPTGDAVVVDRAVLVGRAPQLDRFASTEEPQLVTVPSPQQEVSATHLEVRPGSGADHGSAVATDLGSTNGTLVEQPGLPAEPLRAGVPVQLVPGALLDLGDGVTIRVTSP